MSQKGLYLGTYSGYGGMLMKPTQGRVDLFNAALQPMEIAEEKAASNLFLTVG